MNVAFCIALATQLPRLESGDEFTVTLVTPPEALTLTDTLTVPFADDLSPQVWMRAYTFATPSEIIERSSASGRSLLLPPLGGVEPPLGGRLPPFLYLAQHEPS